MIEFRDRSINALTFGAILSHVSNVLCLLALWALMRYFATTLRHDKIHLKIRIFALLPIVTSMITNTWFGMIGNNAIWPSINTTYPFIDTHCLWAMRVMNIVAIVDMYSISIFILMRTYYFFDQINSLKMSRCVYNTLLVFLTVIAVTYCVCVFLAPDSIFQVTIFHHQHTPKQCELTINNRSNALNPFPLLVLSQSLGSLAILILCSKKLINFMQYLQGKKAHTPLSKHFSGYKATELNVNIIRRFLILSIVFIVSYWACFVVLQYIEWSFFALAIMIKIGAVSASFGIFGEESHSLSIVKTDQNVKKKKMFKGRNLFRRNRRIKYTKVAVATYTRPSTNVIVETDQEGTHDTCINVEEPSISRTHSTLESVFELEEEEMEEWSHDTIKWHLDAAFVEECELIYDALVSVHVTHVYAQLIAEYASTQYLPCVDCGVMFGFVECRHDFEIQCGATAMVDSNHVIQYYLNVEPDSLTRCDIGNDYASQVEILCVDCGAKYKCSKCGAQSLTTCEIVDECIVCRAVFCEFCLPEFMECNEDSDDQKTEEHPYYLICDNCRDNENLSKQEITKLIHKNQSHFDCSHEQSQSSTAHWQQWNFNALNYP